MYKFLSVCFFSIFSLFFFQKSYALLPYPYLEYNMLKAILSADKNSCFTIEPVQIQNTTYIQNINVNTSEQCFFKKEALKKLLSQSLITSNDPSQYQILVDNDSLLPAKKLTPNEEFFQIYMLFMDNPYFVSAKMADWVHNPNLPRLSPAIMIYFKSTIISYPSDNIGQNKSLTYLTSAQAFSQIFDFQKWNMWVSNTISQ